MLEELARTGFYNSCELVAREPLVWLKGKDRPVCEYKDFFKWSDHMHTWDGASVKRLVRQGSDSAYAKAWKWFGSIGENLCEAYVRKVFNGDLKEAMLRAGTFENFFYGFREYFNERRAAYMAEIDNQLAKNRTQLTKSGKMPQSHGGVANLLKVLTKTMTIQGSSIETIAKVQYAVCMQAGIFIPEEFITDVLVASNIIDDAEGRSGGSDKVG